MHNLYKVTPSPTTRKAARLQLAKDATVDAAITAIFAECFEHWTFNEAAALHGLNPEGVHQMRVALRRMRSALSDFKQVIPAAQVAWLRPETRWLIENLGPARDWDVFLTELLKPVEMARPGDTGLAELRAAAEAAPGAAVGAAVGLREAAVPITPRARRVAAELGVDAASLRGSGAEGRIREQDVRDAYREAATTSATASATATAYPRGTEADPAWRLRLHPSRSFSAARRAVLQRRST